MPPCSACLLALLFAGTALEPSTDKAALVDEVVALGPGEVELDGARWRALRPEEPPPPGPLVLRRELRIERVPGGVELEGRWWISSARKAWFANGLLGPDAHVHEVRWNGREATVWSGAQGPTVVESIEGEARLELRAFVPGNPEGGLDLALLGAPRGTVELVDFGDEVTLSGVDDPRPVVVHDGRRSTGASGLRLAVRPPAARDRGPIVVAHVGVGVTVGDAELRGRARIRWEIRRGTRAELSFLAEGVGEDLQVEGPLVSRWRREGADVIVELGGETKGLVDLDLRWSVAAPPGAEASVPLPTLAPHEVFRSDAAVQIARDGEIDVRPELSGWSPIASVQLPEWAEGLVEGTPTAAFSRARSSEGSASLELLRLEPVPGPPMVVDVADVLVATTDEGRAVMRARFEIRNERASHLLVMPPPGMRPVGVTVAGRHVRPSVVEGGALRIPLKRSIETVQGALTVPVTVGLVGEGEAWARRERRELALPAVDAPVSVGRVTLVLPPRYRSRLEPGQGAVVDDFDRGDEVGYGLRDDGQVARADQLFARAVDAWNDNDFEATQAELDDLAELGAHGGNVAGLQANVDLVRPRELVSRWEPAPEEAMATDSVVYDFEDDEMAPMKSRSISSRRPARPAPPPASALERRIRARARARSGEKKAQFERSKSKAKQYKDEGNYEAAAEEYRRAIEDSRDLDALEDEESVEYEFEADQLEGELRAVEAAAAEDPGGGEAESGGGGDEGGDSELLPRDGEFDLVSAAVVAWLGLDEPDSELEPETEPETEPPVETEPETVATVAKDPPEPLAGAVVRVPWAGEVVRYQVLLLEAGEQRGLRIDARKATSTLDRRGRWSR